MKIFNIVFILSLFVTQLVAAQESDQIVIPISGDDNWVKVDIKYGQVNVKGSDRDDVMISWEPLHPTETTIKESKEGLKKIVGGAAGLEINQENQMIVVESSNWTKGYIINLEVPRSINLDISSFNEGDLSAKNIKGIVNLDSYNGKIIADQIRGAVTANTFNGEIKVIFEEILSEIPMAFDTYNGSIDVTFPADTRADLKMKSKGGEILSGFDIALKPLTDVKKGDESDKNGTRKVYLDSWVRGQINGGGSEFTFTNNWGNIYIRKKD